jgi:hypothetical protein
VRIAVAAAIVIGGVVCLMVHRFVPFMIIAVISPAPAA